MNLIHVPGHKVKKNFLKRLRVTLKSKVSLEIENETKLVLFFSNYTHRDFMFSTNVCVQNIRVRKRIAHVGALLLHSSPCIRERRAAFSQNT